MSSRIRLGCETPNGGTRTGPDVCRRIAAMGFKFPITDWAAVAAKGIELGHWRSLWIWRERRGVKRSQSAYHKDLRQGTHPSEVLTLRKAAAVRYLAASTQRRLRERERGRGLLRLSIDPSTEPRIIRPGIFA